MTRPRFEVADVLCEYGDAFLKMHRQPPHVCSAFNLIKICRTAALDGHLDRCPGCGFERPSYNSCRNRHCPKCQTVAKQLWLEARKTELIDVPYFHCVFTLPHELNPLILQNKRLMLGLLFRAVNETLTGFAQHPKWKLEGQPGFIAVLHTWNQELRDHFHLHVIIPAGVLRGSDFIRSPEPRFLFPVRALGNVFAAKYRHHLLRVFKAGELEFHGQLKPLAEAPAFHRLLHSTQKKKSWNVYAKRPFGGPAQVLDYLGRYTHRVAIHNHRIKSIADGHITFTARNRKKNKPYSLILKADEFLRRFTLHILPPNFMKIRAFGFLANTNKRGSLKTIRTSLGMQPRPNQPTTNPKKVPPKRSCDSPASISLDARSAKTNSSPCPWPNTRPKNETEPRHPNLAKRLLRAPYPPTRPDAEIFVIPPLKNHPLAVTTLRILAPSPSILSVIEKENKENHGIRAQGSIQSP